MGLESLTSAITEIRELVKENPLELSLYTAGTVIGGFFLYRYDPGLFKMAAVAAIAVTGYVIILHPMIESKERIVPEQGYKVVQITGMASAGDRFL